MRLRLLSILALIGAASCSSVPDTLAETGLYSDFASRTLAPDVHEYTPAFALWSDGAVKRRFIALPGGTTIDTSHPDQWVFPNGTRLWKEFVVNGKLVETRYITKADGDWQLGAYVWSADGKKAESTFFGDDDVLGTSHDVPAAWNCDRCHGDKEAPLGFTAVQLARAPGQMLAGLDLDEAQSLGWLSQPVANALPLPNDPEARAALGVLHANCGACHSDTGAKKDRPLRLRLFTGVQSFEDSDFFHTALGHEASHEISGLLIYAQPGNPDGSLIVKRMSHRDDDLQMPPLATEQVDSEGLATVRAFIQSLAP